MKDQELQEIKNIEIVENPKDLLDEEETLELEKYEKFVLAKDPRRVLASSTAATFFRLFLDGTTTKELHALNKAFPWGMIIDARIRYNWDEERRIYVKDLFQNVRAKVLKTQIEGIHFLSDLLSASHKNMGERLKRYIQTGDDSIVADIDLTSIHRYGKAVALLAKMTGQDKDLGSLKVLLDKEDEVPEISGESPKQLGKVSKLLPSAVAADIVKMLLKKQEEKEE